MIKIEKNETTLRIMPNPILEVLVSEAGIAVWQSQNAPKDITPEALRALADEMQSLSGELREAADFAEKVRKEF